MSNYHNFIGIDIGKFSFVTAVYGQKQTNEYDYTSSGIKSFLKDHKDTLSHALCILETTGGYEMRLLKTLIDKGYKVHRANTRKVKNFIRSYGNEAKTDQLDAKVLAKYGSERQLGLSLYEAPSKLMADLSELVGRRMDLKKILVAEKNRLKAPLTEASKKSITQLIRFLEKQIGEINSQVKSFINSDIELKEKKKVLETIPGIGDLGSSDLLVLLPELGGLSRREIASLAGIAPKSNDSGTQMGYRRVSFGRSGVKPVLFMAALSASASKSHLGAYYRGLVARGKKKMVALTALMRKIIVIANAKIRDTNSNQKT